jgi:hypothetical protein
MQLFMHMPGIQCWVDRLFFLVVVCLIEVTEVASWFTSRACCNLIGNCWHFHEPITPPGEIT